jgi:hypothetical protein
MDDMAYAHAVLDPAQAHWRANGGKGSFTDLLRAKKARDRAQIKQREQLRSQGLSKSEVDEIMSGLDATHYLDIIAGGNPSALGVGGSRENQRIGPAWAHTNTPSGTSRADQLRSTAEDMRRNGLSGQKMDHVRLRAC